MPAEWEPHAATWLSWPHKQDSWPGRFENIPAVFARIVGHLAWSERVHINVNDQPSAESVRDLLDQGGVERTRIRTHLIPTNDAWCRDHGPSFIVCDRNGERHLAAIDWRFNSWGGKYPPYDLDDQVPAQVAAELGIPRFGPDIVMEGGALEVNGLGTLLTTESCLLNPNRNPHLTKREIEQYLMDYLGVTQVFWLGDGIAGDDTDGHVDDLARFVDPSTIAAVVEEDPADQNFRPLQDNLRRLRSLRDLQGRPFAIVELPMPPALFYEGQRVPCSYANFYIANRQVLVPVFDCAADMAALSILRQLFPGRMVTGIDCRNLVWGLGTLHCITQQQPVSATCDDPAPSAGNRVR